MQFNYQDILEVISSFNRIYFDPLSGNNGDKLIELGSLKLLKQSGKYLVDDYSNSDAIVINGGAGMTDFWGASAIDKINIYIENGSKNIIALPSSFHGNEDKITHMCDLARKNNCHLVLFARDKESFDRLKNTACTSTEIHLAHDMAFFLNPSDITEGFKMGEPSDKYALIVERSDQESATGAIAHPTPIKIPFRNYVPSSIKRSIRR